MILMIYVVVVFCDEVVDGDVVGFDLEIGEFMDFELKGVYDFFRVFRNCVVFSFSIVFNLFLCDEFLKVW